jgi:hypothetical protein
VVKKTEGNKRMAQINYAWRANKSAKVGRALQWWLNQLESATTRAALLEKHGSI